MSRLEELNELEQLIEAFGLKVYCAEQYLAKTAPLQFVQGVINSDDPRVRLMSWRNSSITRNYVAQLGAIEGVDVCVLESGNYALPDLQRRPWLRFNSDTGGMIRDLGTHALAPLVAAGIMGAEPTIVTKSLMKLEDDDK